ncbi:hypothetical protein KSP39_PZI017871 [Platanthera zijinensis]|uniref:Uncharacterized protein n=1 Tax=Platanthera zijinensis TaxID=2320716 RepID=A0AAP0B5C0_9ASPA
MECLRQSEVNLNHFLYDIVVLSFSSLLCKFKPKNLYSAGNPNGTFTALVTSLCPSSTIVRSQPAATYVACNRNLRHLHSIPAAAYEPLPLLPRRNNSTPTDLHSLDVRRRPAIGEYLHEPISASDLSPQGPSKALRVWYFPPPSNFSSANPSSSNA